MSGFTPRETADDTYNAARSMGTARVFGLNADEMAQVTANRLQFIDAAIAACEKAVQSPRVLLREPDNQKLAQMAEALRQHRSLVEKPISASR